MYPRPSYTIGLLWARIAHLLTKLKAVHYSSESQAIVQRTKIGGEPADLLKRLRAYPGRWACRQVMMARAKWSMAK
jgi:hypothetical protein